MTYRAPARRTARRIPTIVVAGVLLLLVAVAATATSLGHPERLSGSWTASPSPPASSSSLASPTAAAASPLAQRRIPPGLGEADGVVPGRALVRRPGHRGALGESDGILPDRTTVSDSQYPGVANLDP